ncbi:aconitase family-domain-containing protein [Lentinula aff. detonsa]|uniref:3-isopropylmalate dehydratase n=1 Tax=Lentinula aff. detonsa TaxID=2804958 RepID=A0AA38KDF5_9AGAR|nr:aconitase family-domain-containing protein [Lentinula aff. detonsa]
MSSEPRNPCTLYDKIWNNHIVLSSPSIANNLPQIIYVDRHLVHEVSSPQAFSGLWAAKRSVRRPDCTLATADHNVPTTPRADGQLFEVEKYIHDKASRAQYMALEKNVRKSGIPYYGLKDIRQGIVHVIAAEQGFILPGTVCVCGDSHTSTLGAFGALAFGIGTSEVEHVLATQTLRLCKSKNMRITISGSLTPGVTSKDLILHIIGVIGTAGAVGFVIEYGGETVKDMNMEERMTMCNMSIEAGARAGLVEPDEVTFTYLYGRPMAPSSNENAEDGTAWDQAMAYWKTLKSDTGAIFDREVFICAEDIAPSVTWGTSPEDNVPITGQVPDPSLIENPQRRQAVEKSLSYMDLQPGTRMEDIVINKVFIGSCTNSRITDLRAAAHVLSLLGPTAKVASGVQAMIVPGSGVVKRQAEEEGLHVLFQHAGFDWREPGCSMCVGLNSDQLGNGERCASTSNRNFRDRQGTGGRTHLVSPGMAIAAAISGHLMDVRKLFHAEELIQPKKISNHTLPSTLFGNPEAHILPLIQDNLAQTPASVRQSRQFISVRGVSVPLQMENIDTDMLIPAPLVKGLTRTGLASALFNRFRFDPVSGQDTDFILNQTPFTRAKIMVCSGANFGCGSSREHAVWALKDFGIACVIAPSYGEIFFNNCLQNGVLPISLSQSTCQILVEYAYTGGFVDVDLVKEQILCVDTGVSFSFRTDPVNRQRLLMGTDDIDVTLEHVQDIVEYELQRKTKYRWLELGFKSGFRKTITNDLSW